jgi:hypothetical protein
MICRFAPHVHGAVHADRDRVAEGCTCYHPLFVFNQFGDLERTLLADPDRGRPIVRALDWSR